MKLEIIKKPHFGFRVVDQDGEAELGSYHIADFAWEEHAEFFVNALMALQGKKK
jgi:hypothetical protein